MAHFAAASRIRARRFGLCAVVVVLALGFVRPGGAADPVDVYTIEKIPLDVTAGTASEAKAGALKEGVRVAFRRLVARLAVDAPVDTRGQGAAIPTDAALGEYVRSYNLANEKLSGVRYLATMTVRFSRPEIRTYFRAKGVLFAETRGRKAIVLPVFRGGGLLVLWENPNLWRAAWQGLMPRHGLLPLSVPSGTLADFSDISALSAVRGDTARILAIGERYGTDRVLVIEAKPGHAAGSAHPTLSVIIARFERGVRGTTEVRLFDAVPGESTELLLTRVAAEIVSDMENSWKVENALRFDRPERLQAIVPVTSLKEWTDMRRRLERISLIDSGRLVALSRQDARIELVFLGSVPQLMTALGEDGLTLDEEAGSWVLRASSKTTVGQPPQP